MKNTLIFIFLLNTTGIFSQDLSPIQLLNKSMDSLINDAIDSMAFPGAQILVIHKGEKIKHQAFGYHTYDKIKEVDTAHLYDLASVTKVMAGGLALMKMQDEHLFYPDQTIGSTLKYLSRSNKENLRWREVLSHQAGLVPYIVFWKQTQRKNGKTRRKYISNKKTLNYSTQVNDDIHLNPKFRKRIKKGIKKSELAEKTYKYSGLLFLEIPDLVKEQTQLELDQYLNSRFFKPMNLKYISFQPYKRFSRDQIVPTEIDSFFRNQLVHGYVHDENAALLNGISANAGLFSNASSLGEISKMWINRGQYNQVEYLRPYIIEEYTSVQFPENGNRRGLTFDKPELDSDKITYISPSASPSSYGHSGFTGTFVWIDPEYDLIFIFLSNRVYPNRSQQKLYSMNLRPKMHELAYRYVKQINIQD